MNLQTMLLICTIVLLLINISLTTISHLAFLNFTDLVCEVTGDLKNLVNDRFRAIIQTLRFLANNQKNGKSDENTGS